MSPPASNVGSRRVASGAGFPCEASGKSLLLSRGTSNARERRRAWPARDEREAEEDGTEARMRRDRQGSSRDSPGSGEDWSVLGEPGLDGVLADSIAFDGRSSAGGERFSGRTDHRVSDKGCWRAGGEEQRLQRRRLE